MTIYIIPAFFAMRTHAFGIILYRVELFCILFIIGNGYFGGISSAIALFCRRHDVLLFLSRVAERAKYGYASRSALARSPFIAPAMTIERPASYWSNARNPDDGAHR